MLPLTNLRLVACGLVSVKALAGQYGIAKSTLYELIKSDPNFPYKNVGLKKKFMIDVAEFESWLTMRTQKQKGEAFNLPPADELLRRPRK